MASTGDAKAFLKFELKGFRNNVLTDSFTPNLRVDLPKIFGPNGVRQDVGSSSSSAFIKESRFDNSNIVLEINADTQFDLRLNLDPNGNPVSAYRDGMPVVIPADAVVRSN